MLTVLFLFSMYTHNQFPTIAKNDLIRKSTSIILVFQTVILDYSQQTLFHVPNKLLFFINISIPLKKIYDII